MIDKKHCDFYEEEHIVEFAMNVMARTPEDALEWALDNLSDTMLDYAVVNKPKLPVVQCSLGRDDCKVCGECDDDEI